MFHAIVAYCCSINAQKFICRKTQSTVCDKQKQKFSNAVERQSMKSAMNSSGHLDIRKDISVKHLVSLFVSARGLRASEFRFYLLMCFSAEALVT